MVYDKVKEACDKKGISISKLERDAELGRGTVRKWQTSSPTIDTLKAAAKVLGVDVKKLID